MEYNILVPKDSYIHNIIKNNTRKSSTDILNSLLNVVILDTRYIHRYSTSTGSKRAWERSYITVNLHGTSLDYINNEISRVNDGYKKFNN